MPRLTLIGYRGTGKSTIASVLASSLKCSWIDADTELERELGRSVAEIIQLDGEEVFRDAESAVLRRLVGQDLILATGGGVILREANRMLLKTHGRPIVWLDADSFSVRLRLKTDPFTASRRPALSGKDVLEEVESTLRFREPLYRECADVRIDTSSIDAVAVVRCIEVWLSSSDVMKEKR